MDQDKMNAKLPVRWWAFALRIILIGPPFVIFCIGDYAEKLCDWLDCRLPRPIYKTERFDVSEGQ